MEKVNITLAFDQEKLNALEFYLKKEKTTAQRRLEESLAQLYEQAGPGPVREYLDAQPAAARPKRRLVPASPRPPRLNRPPIPQNRRRRVTYERRCAGGAVAP